MSHDKRSNDQRPKIVINREKEMRTKETSRMISEGGLGSRAHYNIKKVNASENDSNKNKQNNDDPKKSD